MSKATQTQWRVQVRKSRTAAWKNHSGLFETRKDAREESKFCRSITHIPPGTRRRVPLYGFGNTRVVKYQKK